MFKAVLYQQNTSNLNFDMLHSDDFSYYPE